ncbi:MAG: FAD-dependent oxidoreductase [Acidobacteriota bacterium]
MTRSDAASVLVLGAGITGSLTALRLVERGRAVTLLSAGADPRRREGRPTLSTTGDGGPLRFLTPVELASPLDEAGCTRHRPVSDGGWLAHEHLTEEERGWLARRDLARLDSDVRTDVRQSLTKAGADGLPAWSRLLADHPRLAAPAALRRDGVLRVHDDADRFEADRSRHEQLGLQSKLLSPDELAERHPLLAAACRSGRLAGALLTTGWCLDADALNRAVLDLVEARGARLVFDSPVAALLRDDAGRALGLRGTDGRSHLGDDLVLHPGADPAGLVPQVLPAERCASVLGAWLCLPLDAADRWPGPTKLKVTPRGSDSPLELSVAVDRNGVLWAGGGLMLAGLGGDGEVAIDDGELTALEDRVRDALRLALGSRADDARVHDLRQACRRSQVADGRLLTHVEPTATGRLVLVTGTNTGSTAVAPSLAELACERLGVGHADPTLAGC